MRAPVIILASLLAGGTFLAGAATFGKFGVSRLNEPQGISLREESVRSKRQGFFRTYHLRSHTGGGLSRGK